MDELYIGLMSGTSMDAVDAVLIDLSSEPAHLLASHGHPIPLAVQDRLHALCRPGAHDLRLMAECDARLAQTFADAVNTLLQKASRSPQQIRAIGSHGQTIRHFPAAELRQSIQIGDPSLIASRTGITTVADFRRRDMAEGGQGAPLVPAFHQAMFARTGQNRVIVNIGGIANITALPAAADRPILGFDTGPGNTLLDAWARQHLGRPLDENGQWAASGQINQPLLDHFLAEPYFSRPAPKSTGRELFNPDWQQRAQRGCAEATAAADIAATLVELTARSIAAEITRVFAATDAVYVCGGGVFNGYLLQRLQANLPGTPVDSTGVLGLPPEWVEAMAFAWLARQTLTGRPGNIPAVTGARRSVVLGGIYPA